MNRDCFIRHAFRAFPALALLLLLVSPPTVSAAAWKDDAWVTRVFTEAEVTGTFVLYDPAAGTMTGHDEARANTRFLPASTFKVPNTLIGLASGAVKNVDEILPYGGKPQSIKAWERDMSLRDAIRVSNVAVYQELGPANRAGENAGRAGRAALR